MSYNTYDVNKHIGTIILCNIYFSYILHSMFYCSLQKLFMTCKLMVKYNYVQKTQFYYTIKNVVIVCKKEIMDKLVMC